MPEVQLRRVLDAQWPRGWPEAFPEFDIQPIASAAGFYWFGSIR